jgi:hypothetical protein
MAGTKGAETRIQYSQGRDAYTIIQWTDTAVVSSDEFTITNLPPLFRMLKYKATPSTGTVSPRWTNVTGAAAGSHGDLGSSATTLTTALNEEQNLLVDLTASNGIFYYKDVTSTTATVQHTMIIKAGA